MNIRTCMCGGTLLCLFVAGASLALNSSAWATCYDETDCGLVQQTCNIPCARDAFHCGIKIVGVPGQPTVTALPYGYSSYQPHDNPAIEADCRNVYACGITSDICSNVPGEPVTYKCGNLTWISVTKSVTFMDYSVECDES